MNGILGYLKVDGPALAPGTLEAMARGMAAWGVDGSALRQEGPIGLGCLFSWCTPESAGETLPFEDREHGLLFTAGAFLDNREELLEGLGLSPDESRNLPDTLLVHRAYLRWGEACVHHLTGDWHFALWDGRQRKLFLARDHHGNTGVCYTQGPGFFAFGSNAKALLALPEVPKKPNLLRMGQVLTSWPGDGILTAYEGIFRLPPAHCLKVSGGEAKIRRYWFAEESPIVELPREEDYLEAFLDRYDRAVRARLRSPSPVAATLSGGLDSGSVCTLAARHLREKGERLTAFTSVPVVDTTPFTARYRFGDESEFARATAAQAGNIDVAWIRAEGVSPVAGIERMLEIHDGPGHAAGNQFWIVDLLDAARAGSHRVLLTGQGGNATVSWTGGAVNLLPFLLPWKREQFRSLFLDLQKRQGLSFPRGFKRFLLAPLVAPFRNMLQYGSMKWDSAVLSYSAIHPRFLKSMEICRLMEEEGHDPHFNLPRDPVAVRRLIIQPGRFLAGALWGESSGAFGMDARDPTLDKRLMEFCLGIPDRFHFAEGTDRAVLRRAFKGLLPDEVRLNRKKGLQAADIAYRVQRNTSEIVEILRRMEEHPFCKVVLDLPKMGRVLDSVQSAPTRRNTSDCGTILLRGLGVGLFLMRF